jgi:tRNA threonylcarbamoyladenosine biosynthesis protein TsaB
MTHLLCIDTGTDVCSIAIGNDLGLIAQRNSLRDFTHASVITIYIQECLDELNLSIKDINAVILASGPGSYTGLRVGSSVAKGICFACDIPLIAVDSLTSLAFHDMNLAQGTTIVPIIDARRMDVYTAFYDDSRNMIHEMMKIEMTSAFIDSLNFEKILFCGDGVSKCMHLFDERHSIGAQFSSAQNLLKPGLFSYNLKKFENLDYFSPQYLNKPNITISKKKLI